METVAVHQERRMEATLGSGSTVEAVGGLAAIVLAILGLVGVAPHYMLTIATIALGAGLLFEGGAIAAEYSRLLAETGAGRLTRSELRAGLSAESLAGIAGIVLGILALIGIAPETLMAIAAIVLGAGTLMGSGALARLNHVRIESTPEHEHAKLAAYESMRVAAGSQVLVGFSAIVLGILALIGIAAATLDLVAMLALGAALLLSGTAVTARVIAAFGH
jgi:hypothetical protein